MLLASFAGMVWVAALECAAMPRVRESSPEVTLRLVSNAIAVSIKLNSAIAVIIMTINSAIAVPMTMKSAIAVAITKWLWLGLLPLVPSCYSFRYWFNSSLRISVSSNSCISRTLT